MSLFEKIYEATVIGTFLVLIIYTVETARIRKINAKQKDLQLLPAMMIYIRRHSGSERPFIKNIGFGTAVAVNVMSSNVTESKKFEYSFHLVDGNNTLLPQEEREIGVNLNLDGKKNNSSLSNFLSHYDPANLQQLEIMQEGGTVNKNLPTSRNLEIQFKDITGQVYKTIICFSKDGVSVTEAPERIKK